MKNLEITNFVQFVFSVLCKKCLITRVKTELGNRAETLKIVDFG